MPGDPERGPSRRILAATFLLTAGERLLPIRANSHLITEVIVLRLQLVTVVSFFVGQPESPFPLRTEAPPKEWKADEINNGLPRWEKGTVHVLAWETTEDVWKGERSKKTQILVLKRFDEPTEQGGFRRVLAHLYHRPQDKDRPWHNEILYIPPVLPGKEMPELTDATVFGFELYKELPTDKQLGTFLRETRWAPRLGEWEASTFADDKVVTRKYVTILAAGGVDRGLWKKQFGREVPTKLFPELRRPEVEKK
jgi:hypothetical protein